MATSASTLGPIARHFDVEVWQIRRLFERRILPEPDRIGNYRVIPAEQLPLIESALRQAGYLPEGGPCAALESRRRRRKEAVA
jgi:hypothetical protein